MAGHEGEGVREASTDSDDRQWEASEVWGEGGEGEERGEGAEGAEGGQSECGG